MRETMRQHLDGRKGSARPIATPDPAQVDKAREKTIERFPILERMCPDGLESSVEAISALHRSINGHAADLCGNRSPKDFREILRAEAPITGEDLGRLSVQAPADLAAYLRVLTLRVAEREPEVIRELLAELAPMVGLTVADLSPALAPAEALEALAVLDEAKTDLAAAVIRDLKDGRLDENHSVRARGVEAAALIFRETNPRVEAFKNERQG